MSVLVKGMEMPKHCGYCTLNNGTFCYAVEGKEHESEDVEDYADICERPKWCPLVEIPTPHGRLIDTDKLAKEILRAWNLWEKKGEDCYLFADVITPMLVSQPTVIEGEN